MYRTLSSNLKIAVIAGAALVALVGAGCSSKQDYSDTNGPSTEAAKPTAANPTGAKPQAQVGHLAEAPKVVPSP